MLLLPGAALCCLCSALVATAAELTQDQLSLTSRDGGEASFSCGGTDQSGWIRWFQKKDTGTFTQILAIDTSDGEIRNDYNHPQKDDFTAEIKQNSCELKIKKVKPSHAATYYCARWGSGAHISFTVYVLIFGSGTKLFVTDRPVKTPVVSVYPAASIAALDGKSSLLCVASNMVPPLVQFSWTRQREGGPLETLSSDDGEQLELRGAGRTAAIMVVDRHANYTYNYHCHVRHEGGAVEAPAEQALTAPAPTPPAQTPPPQTPPAAWAWSQRQVKLLWLLYTLLMVKSLVHCGGLALIHILRNRERPAAAHQTTEFPAAASTSH
ncbi:immunoglobulin lambda-1 light chain-like [Platichthys flesus]|uniref:immunoglobulin lambda-1 light chain-like n=1 Tax=Platichthys flesus TaxID=8260 RepID=UPI002DB6216B|nr:immunoglobulin lambda-1 light chain-like [Platichthys flesus]